MVGRGRGGISSGDPDAITGSELYRPVRCVRDPVGPLQSAPSDRSDQLFRCERVGNPFHCLLWATYPRHGQGVSFRTACIFCVCFLDV